ncbi:MAG TPA: hypothetical protein VK718_10625 [Ferruginibacter sp.]|nr:hypothetical protein [Ferruginibacter sp.]
MKQLLFSVFLLFTIVANAQTDAAPTNEDAVNFINKVYNECGKTEEMWCDLQFSIEGCHLLCQSTSIKGNKSGRSDEKAYKSIDTYDIDLSLVKMNNDELYPTSSGAIKLHDIFIVSKRDVYFSTTTDCNSIKWSNHPYSDETSSLNSVLIWWVGGKQLDLDGEIFKSNNYGERLDKAFTFLINTCGGGEAKKDPNDKF